MGNISFLVGYNYEKNILNVFECRVRNITCLATKLDTMVSPQKCLLFAYSSYTKPLMVIMSMTVLSQVGTGFTYTVTAMS